MQGSYLGMNTQQEIEKELKTAGAVFDTFEYEKIIDQTAELLSNEKLLAGFREEWNLVQEH